MLNHRTKKPNVSEEPVEEVSEAEQWRLVKESGVLQRASVAYESPDTADEVFNAILLIIPFSFLYLMMDILTHQQYGRYPSLREYAGRLLSGIPVLSIFIFFTNSRKLKRSTQMGLFLASIAVGTRLIWLVNRAPWYVVMRQGPPLATLWIYAIAILNLLPAVFSLALVTVWCWYSGMKLGF